MAAQIGAGVAWNRQSIGEFLSCHTAVWHARCFGTLSPNEVRPSWLPAHGYAYGVVAQSRLQESGAVEIAAAVFIGFFAAGVAPIASMMLRRGAGVALALVPLALFVYFSTYLGALPPEGRTVSLPWAASFGLQLSFHLDGLSLLFVLLITGIGAIVLVYSAGYLAGDARLGRLYAWLLAFMASMLGVVLSDNMFAIFVFWELTSITSYMLIGFDHERQAARSAALQALLITSGGGLALLVGFVWLGQVGLELGLQPAEAHELSAWISAGHSTRESQWYVPILVLVLCGAFTKSAQFPFHFWLPSAMEAPTPVSAYLHSATMVKAGVYLLARLTPILGDTATWHWALMSFGTVTMLIGATIAIQVRDLKQILAYSTVSALGLSVLLIGHGGKTAVAAAVTFLLAHALYKGALFLVAGAVDHAARTRNVDQLSGLRRAMPITAVAAALAALSMAAVPPLFGFVAKEQFYVAILQGPAPRLFIAAAVIASALFVAIAVAVGVRPFWGNSMAAGSPVHEAPTSMWLGTIILAVGGVLLGIFPALVDLPVLAPAAQAILNQPLPNELHLALWHGLNLPFALSMVTIVAGLGIYVFRGPLAAAIARLSFVGLADAYESSLEKFLKFAELQTHILQSGYLRYYLMTILLSSVALIGYTAFFRDGLELPLLEFEIAPHEAAICLLIPIACLAVIRAPSRLSAIVALGVVGYSVALIFVLFGAPDLAMTQFLIETLTVVLFVFAFYHLPSHKSTCSLWARIRDGFIAIIVGAVMATLVLLTLQDERSREISDYYAAHSVADAHGRNIVNVILVDFRALDTLGEITVLALAAVGVYSLLKLRPPEAPR